MKFSSFSSLSVVLTTVLYAATALNLNLPLGDSEYDIVYTSLLVLETPFNPNYTYNQLRKEYLSLDVTNEGDGTYNIQVQTNRFVSNITEYTKEDRYFDSDINYTPEQKAEDPIFSTIVNLVFDNKGIVIDEPDVPENYVPSIALHFIRLLYDITKDASNQDIVNNNVPKKWEIVLGMPRQQGYHEYFDAILKVKKKKDNNNNNNSDDGEESNIQRINLLKGRLQDTDKDETINDAKLKGYFKFDINTGLIRKFKMLSTRDVDDPKMGFHSLKEDMVLTITPRTPTGSQTNGEPNGQGKSEL